MSLGLILRVTAYLTFAFGLLMRLGYYPLGVGTKHLHMTLALALIPLAPLAISRRPGPKLAVRWIASVLPLLTFAIGLGLFLGKVPWSLRDVHVLLGIATVALFDISLRAQRVGAIA